MKIKAWLDGLESQAVYVYVDDNNGTDEILDIVARTFGHADYAQMSEREGWSTDQYSDDGVNIKFMHDDQPLLVPEE